MDSERAEIVIRFDAGASPITGDVRADGSAPCAFTGWAGLFAVLRAVAPEEQVIERSPTRS